jgi:uncharacterized protein YdcH (DUF465 family)
MHVEHHPLINEFPELRESIHNLKMSSAHFAKLAEEYEAVDKHICRAESDAEGYDDKHMHELKAERLRLKDEVYKVLAAA